MKTEKPQIAISSSEVTIRCVEAARSFLESAGCDVTVFEADGIGGRNMESLIRQGKISGVLDIATTELACELVRGGRGPLQTESGGGIASAGPDRLTAAGLSGVPQVISVGALDIVELGSHEDMPEEFKARRFCQYNPTTIWMRTTPEENDKLGQEIANKACASQGPTAILLPMRGVSALDVEGGPFWWPQADEALFQSLRNWCYGIELVEIDSHINDPVFATTAAKSLLSMLVAKQ